MSDDINEKLKWLDASVVALFDFAEGGTKKAVWEEAKINAHAIILEEISVRLGAAPGDFRNHYQALVARLVGRCLDQTESTSPSVAAKLDDRPVWMTDTGEPIPPLFRD